MSDPGIYTTGGTVQAGGGVYLRRAADDELLSLCREGTFAFVLTARQMGKSSLMTRAVEQLATEDVRSVVVDLNSLGKRLTPGQWYLGFLSEMETQLELGARVSEWWNARAELGTTHRLTRFFLDVLLPQVKERIVVFVDEIDTTLRLDFTDDFFACIRSLYNARAQHPDLHRLSFVLLGAAAPTDLIKDPTRTPFNLGKPVELTDFTREEARPLASGLGLPADQAEQVLGWVLKWTGGHPYLTQRICAEYSATNPKVATPEAIAALVERLFLGDRSFEDNNLQFVRDMLIRRAPDVSEVLATYAQVVRGLRRVRDEEQSPPKAHLKLSGVVRREQDALVVRNSIYRQVFSLAWARANSPFHWGPFVRRTSLAIAVVGFIVLAPAALFLWRQWQTVEVAREQVAKALKSAEADAQRQRDITESARRSARADMADAQARLADARRQAEESQAKARDLAKAKEDTERLNEELRGERDAAKRDRASTAASLDAAQSLKLANQAQSKGAPLSVLLAAEGVRRRRSPDGLRGLVSQVLPLRKAVVTFATGAPVYSMAFSPDGTRVATAQGHGKVCVWQSSTGTLDGCMGTDVAADNVSFSKSGDLVVATGLLGTALWDVARRIDRSGFGGGMARSVSFSPDGALAATTTWDDGKARVWDVRTGRLVSLLSHDTPDSLVVLGPRQDALTVGQDKQLRIWDLATTKVLAKLPEDRVPRLARFSPDGKTIATALGDTVRVWSSFNTSRRELKCEGEIYSLQFSAGGQYLLAASEGHICSWYQGTLDTSFSSPGRAVALSSDERRLAIMGSDNVVEIHDLSNWQRDRAAILPHEEPVRAVAFSADGWRVAIAGERTIRIWDLDVNRSISELAYQGKVQWTGFTPDGAWVILREDGAEIWDVARARRLVTLDDVRSLQLLPDAKTIGTLGGGLACLRDVGTGRKRCSKIPRFSEDVQFLPGGKVVGASDLEGVMYTQELETGQREILYSYRGYMKDIAVSTDGRMLASATYDGTVIIWDLLKHTEVTRLPCPSKVITLRFSADHQFLATGDVERTVRIWDVATGRKVRALAHGDPVGSMLPDTGPKILTDYSSEYSGTRELAVWDYATGERLFSTHEDLRAAHVSPDGRTLVATGTDETIRVWDLSNGALLAWIRFADARDASFSPDGELLAVTTNDGAYVISWRSADVLKTACSLLPRNLTAEEWTTYVGNEPYQKTCPNLPGPEVSSSAGPRRSGAPAAGPPAP